MKRIDLHIHTLATVSDSAFDFSLAKLKEYIQSAHLDAIAITNHNCFNLQQYEEIVEELSINVFPGIEVDVESCHILLIGEPTDAQGFADAAAKVSSKITTATQDISVEELKSAFGDLDKYLVIPHSDKNPKMRDATKTKLEDVIFAGEVDSAKKFIRCHKDTNALVPVIFSDARMHDDLGNLPTRSTFVDCGEISLTSLKVCLRDRAKVALSAAEGNNLFEVLPNGLKISTGLNVFLGDRSTGKTFVLKEISKTQPNTQHIEQFSLVQRSEDESEREFASALEQDESTFKSAYLASFKVVVDDVLNIDIEANEKQVQRYLDSLLKSAAETDRNDTFSKAKLYSESLYRDHEDTSLRSLISSVKTIIENDEYRDTIAKYLDHNALRALFCDLVEQLRKKRFDWEMKDQVNAIVTDVRRGLGVRSSATQVDDVDLYQIALEKNKIDRFQNLVKTAREEGVITERGVADFKIVAKRGRFRGASELRKECGSNGAFTDAMQAYDGPYQFLLQLKLVSGLAPADYYRHFIKIDYEILNRDGVPVSGGERSEFKLLQKISDAQKYDLLLIDEPESSFDNTFLHSSVNALLKDIARTMPVVVVTHNSTIGASVGADYVLISTKDNVGGVPEYKVFGGYPTDKKLICTNGSSIESHSHWLSSLEAGLAAHEQRRTYYETIKD